MRRPDRADGMLVLANVLWSLNYATTKYAFERWNPLAFSGVRFTAAGLAMAAIVLRLEGSLRIARADVPRVVLAGATGIFLNQLTFNYALDYTAAANVALILGAAPAFTAAFVVALGHERVRPLHWVALGVSLCGVALVVQGGSGLAGFSLAGDLLAIGAALTWAAYSVMLRPLFGRYSAMRLSTLMILVGAVLMAPFAAVQLARPGLRRPRDAALGRARLLGDLPARRHERALLRRPAPRRRRSGDPLHVPAAVPGSAVCGDPARRAHRRPAAVRRGLRRRRRRARPPGPAADEGRAGPRCRDGAPRRAVLAPAGHWTAAAFARTVKAGFASQFLEGAATMNTGMILASVLRTRARRLLAALTVSLVGATPEALHVGAAAAAVLGVVVFLFAAAAGEYLAVQMRRSLADR